MEDDLRLMTDEDEISNNENVPIKNRLFYFYYQINKKNEINEVVTSIFIVIETLQQISFVFSEPLYSLWKIKNEKTGDFLKKIITGPRLSQLFRLVKFNVYLIVWIALVIILFSFIISILLSIQINNMKFTFFRFNVILGSYCFNAMNGVLLNPILETLLLMVKCENKKVEITNDGIECFKSIHILYLSITILFFILFFIVLITNELFNFSPIEKEKEIVKINNSSEIIYIFLKIIILVLYIVNASDWMIICVGLLGYFKLLKENFEEITYNSHQLELLLCIRNCSISWAYLMIFLAYISKSNKFIYFLLFGYPLVILLSIILKNYFDSNKYIGYSPSAKDANEYLQKLFFFIRLARDKIQSQKTNSLNGMSDILLKGYISLHEENCIDEDCPLKTYITTSNENIQRMCLLNFINNNFSTGLRYYPTSHRIKIEYVKFNLSLKFNVNNAKMLISQIEESDKSITEEYIFYTIKETMNSMYVSHSNNHEEETEISDGELNMKFKKLKNLIEETTKLFNDFWGNLGTNLSMNLAKIFILGKKLNSLLKDIQNLWDKDLKNTKIEPNTQSIAQLYAFFLKKILRNKHASEEVLRKIEEESHLNYKKYDNQKISVENLDTILENPDIICFARTNNKGECDIIQCSNSFVHFIGYQKFNLIGKKVETIMPSIFHEENAHAKMLSKRLKNAQNFLARDGIYNLDKKQNKIICPKEKNGFIRICLIRHTLYSEDDFGNSFLIKVKFEPRDLKSNYPFYILAKNDFTIESISSSALNLGLTQDLIKKHIIDLNILIRNESFNAINFNDRVDDYEDEAKPVFWVYPYFIYPKDDNVKNIGEIDIEKVVSESKRKKFNLVISKIRYSEDVVLAYLFRFIEIKGDRNDKEYIQNQELKLKDEFNVMYDLYNLHYIRTKLVFEKEGTINDELKTINNFEGKVNPITQSFIFPSGTGMTDEGLNINRKKSKKNKRKDDSISEEEEPLKEITKDSVNKLQTRNSLEIQDYIFSLTFYGKSISLEKHRPNKERYPTGMSAEPLIKINLMEFKNKVDKKLKKKKQYNKKVVAQSNNNDNDELNNNIALSEDENSNKIDNSTPEKKEKVKEEEISVDPNTYLNQYVGNKSIKRIQFLSIFMFIIMIILIVFEFIQTITYLNKIVDSLKIGQNSYDVIDGIAYSKYFLTEVILLKDPEYPHKNYSFNSDLDYIHNLMNELSIYQGIISTSYSYITSSSKIKYIKGLSNYMDSLLLYLNTISNGEEHVEFLSLSSAMGRLGTDLFFVSIIRDNTNQISMTNKNTYDLMVNLLNDYTIYWNIITQKIFEAVYSFKKMPNTFYASLALSFVFVLINGILLVKFLKSVILEKEKPLELFFTIKKKIFESLKTESEVFLNNLLNKIVGNDDVEQETKSEASLKIIDNDIIIQKLKNKNHYQKVGRSKKEFLKIYLNFISIFIITEIFLVIKFIKVKTSLNKYSRYSKVLNATEFCHFDLISICDFTKSFFYNQSIKILNSSDTENVILEKIQLITEAFGEMILAVYDNLNYLNNNYGDFFYEMLNGDINNIIQGGKGNVENLTKTKIYGCKSVAFRYFDMFKFLWQNYLLNKTDKYLYYPRFEQINNVLRNIIRPWFTIIIEELYKGYYNFHDSEKLFHIYAFIIILAMLIIYYLFIWRSQERDLKEKLNNSLELLNLLPGELKLKMVDKLKEEEENINNN